MKHIHIFGASGSGTTTLGQALSKQLPYHVFDSDDYYWETKYSQAREVEQRVKLLRGDLAKQPSWILSGALCGWGDELKGLFDLVIFLYTPEEVRLNRLRNREHQRYGDRMLEGGDLYLESKKFLKWAAQYDSGGLDIRSKLLHEDWMASLTCRIIRIEGVQTVEERVQIVLDYISKTK